MSLWNYMPSSMLCSHICRTEDIISGPLTFAIAQGLSSAPAVAQAPAFALASAREHDLAGGGTENTPILSHRPLVGESQR